MSKLTSRGETQKILWVITISHVKSELLSQICDTMAQGVRQDIKVYLCHHIHFYTNPKNHYSFTKSWDPLEKSKNWFCQCQETQLLGYNHILDTAFYALKEQMLALAKRLFHSKRINIGNLCFSYSKWQHPMYNNWQGASSSSMILLLPKSTSLFTANSIA